MRIVNKDAEHARVHRSPSTACRPRSSRSSACRSAPTAVWWSRSAPTRPAKCASLVTDYSRTPPPASIPITFKLIDVDDRPGHAGARPLPRAMSLRGEPCRRFRSDKPRELTGRTVLLWLDRLLRRGRSCVNGIMANAAISTFGGVETQNSYKAGLAVRAGSRRWPRRRTRCTGTSTASSISTASARRVLDMTVRDAAGQPVGGLDADARLCASRPIAGAITSFAMRETGAGAFHGDGACAVRPAGTWSIEFYRGDRAPVPLAQRDRVEVTGSAGHPAKAGSRARTMTDAALDLSLYAKPCGDAHARHGSGGRGRRLRRLHPRASKARLKSCPASPRRGSTSPIAGCTSPGATARSSRRRSSRRWSASAIAASVRAAARRGGRGAPGAPPDALSGGRRLCRHEHHAAVGLGVVGHAT